MPFLVLRRRLGGHKRLAVLLLGVSLSMITFFCVNLLRLENTRTEVQNYIDQGETGFLTRGYEYYVIDASASPESVTEALLRLKQARIPTNGVSASYCQLTERHWQLIGEMTYLRSLSVGFSNADNNAMRHVANLKSLRRLILPGTAVTDEGLDYLGMMPKLEVAYLPCAGVTKTGIRRFCENAPRLNVDDLIRNRGECKTDPEQAVETPTID